MAKSRGVVLALCLLFLIGACQKDPPVLDRASLPIFSQDRDPARILSALGYIIDHVDISRKEVVEHVVGARLDRSIDWPMGIDYASDDRASAAATAAVRYRVITNDRGFNFERYNLSVSQPLEFVCIHPAAARSYYESRGFNTSVLAGIYPLHILQVTSRRSDRHERRLRLTYLSRADLNPGGCINSISITQNR